MIEKLLSTVITTLTVIYLLHKISNRKINFRNYNIYITFFIMVIFSFFNLIFVNNFIRLAISTLIVFIGNYIIFKEVENGSIFHK